MRRKIKTKWDKCANGQAPGSLAVSEAYQHMDRVRTELETFGAQQMGPRDHEGSRAAGASASAAATNNDNWTPVLYTHWLEKEATRDAPKQLVLSTAREKNIRVERLVQLVDGAFQKAPTAAGNVLVFCVDPGDASLLQIALETIAAARKQRKHSDGGGEGGRQQREPELIPQLIAQAHEEGARGSIKKWFQATDPGAVKILISTYELLGTGHNDLERACHLTVLFYVSRLPSSIEQAVGRLTRPAQTRQVEAYVLYTELCVVELLDMSVLASRRAFAGVDENGWNDLFQRILAEPTSSPASTITATAPSTPAGSKTKRPRLCRQRRRIFHAAAAAAPSQSGHLGAY
ncbi:hypothetical protein SODALDRAFT_151753 [Sodiomyces alkalinus F11]|uniref:Uncharacterized protein n=1 Tax=Sodiomyces alkalinus (strain CBS 110278 / VKM F-3762 / F11) TaxID=1314773 RepID=A0A3N2PX59_SODAK|nr:hypothetical protein SODALDRAFT_151753 [Sodiomyces alkalinus F11]ROT39077.1 hypothetical protein SODALDRAFT_151753 [Sodiomyces alkalinus F11]